MQRENKRSFTISSMHSLHEIFPLYFLANSTMMRLRLFVHKFVIQDEQKAQTHDKKQEEGSKRKSSKTRKEKVPSRKLKQNETKPFLFRSICMYEQRKATITNSYHHQSDEAVVSFLIDHYYLVRLEEKRKKKKESQSKDIGMDQVFFFSF